MIAREHEWKNEGSIYGISDALKVITIVVSADQNTQKKIVLLNIYQIQQIH